MFESDLLSKKFKLASVIWWLSTLFILIFYYLTETKDMWNILMYIELILSLILIFLFIAIEFYCSNWINYNKILKKLYLIVSGPYLLSVSIYGFLVRDHLDLNNYAVHFLSWWLMFSVGVYCSFKLSLDIMMYYHKKEKAKRYENNENPNSPFI